MDCLFCKIVNREIPADIVFEDELVMAFKDIHPKAMTHLLIVPKKHIPNFNHLEPATDPDLMAIMHTAQKLALDNGIDQTGYRLVFNTNDHGGQEVQHLHLHLIGGEKLGRMA